MGSPGGKVVDDEALGWPCGCATRGLFWNKFVFLKFVQVFCPPKTLSASRCAFPSASTPSYHAYILLSPGALYLMTSLPRLGFIPFWNCITRAAPLKFVSMANDLKLST